jgi:gamma-aminobutyric acid receptor subunit beta
MLIALSFSLAAFSAPGVVSAAGGDNQHNASERPNAGGPADRVLVEFALLDIDDIDDKQQRFSIDAYFEIKWQDRRLAVDTGEDQGGRVRTFATDKIWTPGLTIVNDRGLSLKLPEVVQVDSDGNATLRQRISGSLASNLNLRDFPFDTQTLSIDIVSYRHTPNELTYSTTTTFVGDTSKYSADGWDFELQEPAYSVFKLVEDRVGAPQLTLAISASRQFSFFILTLALPMTLILFLTWTVHWLQPDLAPSRLSMSTAAVFSLIALGISFRLSLPQIDYLTQADRFVMYSTFLVLISLGITVLATRWVNEDRLRDAVRLTGYTRWGFPLIFVLIIVLTLRA